MGVEEGEEGAGGGGYVGGEGRRDFPEDLGITCFSISSGDWGELSGLPAPVVPPAREEERTPGDW